MKERDPRRWLDILACPICHSPLRERSDGLVCTSCAHEYRTVDGVPILLTDAVDVQTMPTDHVSNPIPPEFVSWLSSIDGYSLNIGAGTSNVSIPRCVELEYSIFPTTDVIADAHRLPFSDGVFDAVIALNTFEHLRAPETAAAEIRRVLRPGGRVVVRTAFIQPLHEEPINYYNVTEYGLREWFRSFSIESCTVPDDMSPALGLGWLATELMWYVGLHLGWDVSERLGTTTLDEWRQVWATSRPDPEARTGMIWDTIRQLPPEIQARFAMGFDLKAERPAAESGTADGGS